MKNYSQKINDILESEIDPAYIDRAEVVLQKIINQKNILEIGCGRGFYLNSINKIKPKTKLTGIDLNQKYLDKAKKFVNNKLVKIIKGDATKLSFSKNTFDGIIASEVLEHIDNDTKVLEEISRVLTTNGIVMISVPNQNYPFLWDPINWCLEKYFNTHVPSKIWWLAGIWADHKRLYNESDLVIKIQKSGLKVKKIWRKTKYCFPFSHFLFYGVGKNLVENGYFKNFNRFETNKQKSFIFKTIKKIISWADKGNDKIFFKEDKTVGLIVMAQKS